MNLICGRLLLMRAIIVMTSLTHLFASELQPVTTDEARLARDQIGKFLTSNLTDASSGAVFVNAARDRPVIAGEARNRDCLSEAAGQMMELALLRNDQVLFEKQFQLVKNRFSGGKSGFLAWKISVDSDWAATTSATLDDWRVVWAAGQAGKKWGFTKVGDFGRELAAAIVHGSGDRVLPPSAFNLSDGSPGDGAVLLCYLHLPAMAAFAGEMPDLRKILTRSQILLESSSGAVGMVPQSWNPKGEVYSSGSSDETLALLALQYLQGFDARSQLVQDAVKFRIDYFTAHGELPQAFDVSDGSPQAGTAGASVYAMFARLLVATGNLPEAGKALRKMLEFQNQESDPYAGAIGGYPVFSFDQLEALLALEDFLGASRSSRKSFLQNADDAVSRSPVSKDL
jgi:hypothetical protein